MSNNEVFHLIGVGGAGMSVIAQLLVGQGHTVTGSDKADSPLMQQLLHQGVGCYVGHDASRLEPNTIVVVSTAVKETNPELCLARQRGQEIWHRSQALAWAARRQQFIAVAGAHGKTTTSAMLTLILVSADLDPSFAVGSVVEKLGTGGRVGTGLMLVAEADESDGSFLNYEPRIAIITNIEPDHLDHYGSVEAFEKAFLDFTKKIQPGGLLVCDGDDLGVRKLLGSIINPDLTIYTYGFESPPARADFHLQLGEFSQDRGTSQCGFDMFDSGRVLGQGQIELQVPGKHNISNAAGALMAAYFLGVEVADILRSLAEFKGTARRFETRGERNGVRVVDDYAHHPTEVKATVRAAVNLAQSGRVLVLFQPHLFSRTQNFASDFASALALADEVIVCGIYGAREEPIEGVEGDLITQQMEAGRASFIPDMSQAAQTIGARAKPGDLILTLGAGSITTVADKILDSIGTGNATPQ